MIRKGSSRAAQHTTVILTHENADFDAIAALVAAARLYPEAIPSCRGASTATCATF